MLTTTRRLTFITALLFAPLAALHAADAPTPPVKPKMLGIVMDDAGAELPCDGETDLVVFDIASSRTIPLPRDGDPGTIENGHWAGWSPDGQWITYIQSDSSAVPKRAVLVPGDPTCRTFREQRYERIGGPISTFRIGVVGVEGGLMRWIVLADKPGTFYLNQASWAGNSDELRAPKENPGGYRTSAPISYVEGLRGDLLIITGSGGSNTHIEITEGLVDRHVALGKRFECFVYPNRDHGLAEGRGSIVHVRMLIARCLLEHLPPGPR